MRIIEAIGAAATPTCSSKGSLRTRYEDRGSIVTIRWPGNPDANGERKGLAGNVQWLASLCQNCLGKYRRCGQIVRSTLQDGESFSADSRYDTLGACSFLKALRNGTQHRVAHLHPIGVADIPKFVHTDDVNGDPPVVLPRLTQLNVEKAHELCTVR